MILTIDIGNTYTKLRGYKGNITVYQKDCITDADTLKLMTRVKSLRNMHVNICGIASVVPAVTKKWKKITSLWFKINPIIISNKIRLPIKLKVKNPDTLGADRICNAVAGYLMFKGKENVIVADLGSANTFDVVLKNGDYTGGIITPGLDLLADSLYRKTAQLPKITVLNKPKSLIGNRTPIAIKSGVYFTFFESVNGIIKRIIKHYKKDFKIILTGGKADIIKDEINADTVFIPAMVNKGILQIFRYNGY
jgi:type III pantothenate kinase